MGCQQSKFDESPLVTKIGFQGVPKNLTQLQNGDLACGFLGGDLLILKADQRYAGDIRINNKASIDDLVALPTGDLAYASTTSGIHIVAPLGTSEFKSNHLIQKKGEKDMWVSPSGDLASTNHMGSVQIHSKSSNYHSSIEVSFGKNKMIDAHPRFLKNGDLVFANLSTEEVLIYTAASEYKILKTSIKYKGNGGVVATATNEWHITTIAVLPNDDIAVAYGSYGRVVIWHASSEYTTNSVTERLGHIVRKIYGLQNGDLACGLSIGRILIVSVASDFQSAFTLYCNSGMQDMVLMQNGDLACCMLNSTIFIWKAAALVSQDSTISTLSSPLLK